MPDLLASPAALAAPAGRHAAAQDALEAIMALPTVPLALLLNPLALKLLLDPRTTTDTLLIFAEALAELEDHLRVNKLPRAAEAVRDYAAALARAAPAFAHE